MLRLPKKVDILYIEDDKDQFQLIEEMLSKSEASHFNIVHRGSLKESIKYIDDECYEPETCKVDIILLDLVLPNSSGVNTFKEIYNKCDFLPIVIISRFEEMACECVKLGAQDYLIKNELTASLLVRSLKYAVERKKIIEEKVEIAEKFRELVEVTRAIIYEIDFKRMKFVYVNDEMCKLTGWTREELLELSPSDVLTERGINEFIERMEKLKMGDYIPETHEFEVKLKDGSIGWTLITAKYKEDENKNVIGANVVAIDITESKLADVRLMETEQKIFAELENKVQEWRDEIVTDRKANQNQLNEINLDIMSMGKRTFQYE